MKGKVWFYQLCSKYHPYCHPHYPQYPCFTDTIFMFTVILPMKAPTCHFLTLFL